MSQKRDWKKGSTALALGSLVTLALVLPAAAQGPEWTPQRPCSLQGAWLSEVDIGARFFVSYASGASATSGPLAVEWIAGDPSLFGAFPAAVSLTQGVGTWQRVTGHSYRYTWISYGLDADGQPLYAWKGSGTGVIQGCNMIVFDYVAEIFPMPLDPLLDDPVDCIEGSGTKVRMPIELASCP